MKLARTICQFSLAVVLGLSLSGCDRFQEKISNLVAPKTPQQVLESVHQKLFNHQYKDALAELEEYGKSNPAYDDGQFAWAAAKASFALGKLDEGYSHLRKAFKSKAATMHDAMVEPLFETVRTDIRFVRILTETFPPPAPVATGVASSGMLSTAVRAEIGAGSVSANAGGVTVKIGQ